MRPIGFNVPRATYDEIDDAPEIAGVGHASIESESESAIDRAAALATAVRDLAVGVAALVVAVSFARGKKITR